MFGLFGGKTFTPENDIPDLSGKVILVTGGNTGLGKETILQLAAHNPSAIYLGARTESKAQTAITDIKTIHPNAPIHFLPLDLTSFSSIAAAAKTFTTESKRLDLLINNAGVMALPYSQTPQSHEIQFGTNHIGHALLTKLLLPTLSATAARPESPDARIVNLSSMGHNLAPTGGIIFSQPELENHGTWARYGQSKLANILHAAALRKHHPEILSVAVHPGVILTDLYASQEKTNFVIRWGLWAVGGLVMGDVKAGAKNQIWAAVAPVEEVRQSVYFNPVGIAAPGSSYARDEALADELWEWTEAELKKNGY